MSAGERATMCCCGDYPAGTEVVATDSKGRKWPSVHEADECRVTMVWGGAKPWEVGS